MELLSKKSAVKLMTPVEAGRPKAEVIVLPYKGYKFTDALYEKVEGITINGAQVTNIAGDSVEYLQARVDALLRQNNSLTEERSLLIDRVEELMKENVKLQGFIK